VHRDPLLRELYGDPKRFEFVIGSQADVPFWKDELCRRRARSMLELCCGTGRLGAELAPHLERYDGVDLSDESLERHRRRLAAGAVGAHRLICADVREVRTGQRYDVVGLPFNSLSHFHEPPEIMAVLQTAFRHVADEGVFILDTRNPASERRTGPAGRSAWRLEGEDSEPVDVIHTTQYDAVAQIERHEYVYELAGTRHELSVPMRVFFPQELDCILLLAGFTVEQKFGTFDRQPFRADSRLQVVVCRRPRAA
jgi:SAM-dependent methyltransferase